MAAKQKVISQDDQERIVMCVLSGLAPEATTISIGLTASEFKASLNGRNCVNLKAAIELAETIYRSQVQSILLTQAREGSAAAARVLVQMMGVDIRYPLKRKIDSAPPPAAIVEKKDVPPAQKLTFVAPASDVDEWQRQINAAAGKGVN